MATQQAPKKIVTPIFRVSYSKIFRPDENDDGKKVYSVAAIFEPDADLSAMKQLVKEAKTAKWQNKTVAGFREPFRKGTSDEYDLERYPEYEGKIICSFKSHGRAVGVIGPDKQEIIDEEDFYSGCYARASITAYAYEKNGNKGVAFSLSSLMKVKDGERMSGGKSDPEADFKEFPAEGLGEENASEFDDAGI